MPRRTIDFETVRKIGLALPGVEEGTAYGSPALKVHGKLLACVPAHRSAEPGSLVIRVHFEDRAELLAADPDVYYVTDHYVGYNAVLVRLSRVNRDVLRGLLGMAYKFVTRGAAPRSPARKRESSAQEHEQKLDSEWLTGPPGVLSGGNAAPNCLQEPVGRAPEKKLPEEKRIMGLQLLVRVTPQRTAEQLRDKQ